MSKSIIKKLKYIRQICISMNKPDDVEPDCLLNIFSDRDTLYGWKEYDLFKNRHNLKSNAWELGYSYNFKFIPKDKDTYLNKPITIVQRLKESV